MRNAHWGCMQRDTRAHACLVGCSCTVFLARTPARPSSKLWGDLSCTFSFAVLISHPSTLSALTLCVLLPPCMHTHFVPYFPPIRLYQASRILVSAARKIWSVDHDLCILAWLVSKKNVFLFLLYPKFLGEGRRESAHERARKRERASNGAT